MPWRATTIAAVFLPVLAIAGEKPAVIELFEDDTAAIIPLLTMGGIGGGEDVKIEAETTDVFSGKSALRVAPSQRFSPDIKDWRFTITEKPKVGEYRYLRFAWKKVGDGPLMIQFHTRFPAADWVIRYQAGPNPPWPANVVSLVTPTDWQVVTRDLYKDFGAVIVGGIALTPHNGGDGLFDHILLGRTLEDLDRATAAAVIKTPTKAPLTQAQLTQYWEQVGSVDPIVAETARWELVRGHAQALPFLARTIILPEQKAPKPVDEAIVVPLIADLTHYRYVRRAAATDALIARGPGVLPSIRRECAAAEGDERTRLRKFLDDWSAREALNTVRLRRCVTLLRSIGTPDANELLGKIENALP
ncbi:MAG TPA: hypothetical protein VHR66_03275 [Gemmataceae bacterium]|jgi:hypothetical protein|nr:hypothetical protein [Gemmataceae bacterium]